MTYLERISGRIPNGFYEKAAIWEENFAIYAHRKHYIELKMCGIDKGRRILRLDINDKVSKHFLVNRERILWKSCYLRQEFRDFWSPEVLN